MRKATGDTGFSRAALTAMQLAMLLALFGVWWALTATRLLPPFFFGEPFKVLAVIANWFVSGKIWPHLAITLWETVLAFAIGSVLGLVVGLWLALSPLSRALAEPYITAMNAMPRVILA